MIEFNDTRLPQRFWAKVTRAGDCWIWTGFKTRQGYGSFRWQGRARPAHRVALSVLVAEVLSHLVVDHLCRNRACVNPAHLRAVTSGENTRAPGSLQAEHQRRKTTCPQGHALAGERPATFEARLSALHRTVHLIASSARFRCLNLPEDSRITTISAAAKFCGAFGSNIIA